MVNTVMDFITSYDKEVEKQFRQKSAAAREEIWS